MCFGNHFLTWEWTEEVSGRIWQKMKWYTEISDHSRIEPQIPHGTGCIRGHGPASVLNLIKNVFTYLKNIANYNIEIQTLIPIGKF